MALAAMRIMVKGEFRPGQGIAPVILFGKGQLCQLTVNRWDGEFDSLRV